MSLTFQLVFPSLLNLIEEEGREANRESGVALWREGESAARGREAEADKKAAEAAITNPLMSKLRKRRRRRRREGGGVTRMANFPSLALWKCSCRKKWKREGAALHYLPSLSSAN